VSFFDLPDGELREADDADRDDYLRFPELEPDLEKRLRGQRDFGQVARDRCDEWEYPWQCILPRGHDDTHRAFKSAQSDGEGGWISDWTEWSTP
jgi:hypothetical protein